METKVCHVIKLSEKLNSRLLVQEEHGFQKGAQCAQSFENHVSFVLTAYC